MQAGAAVRDDRALRHPEDRGLSSALRVAVVGTLALLAGCGGKPPSLVGQGRQVFVRAGCGDCHRVAAVRGSGGSGPDFDTSEQLPRSEIRVELNAGVGGMPSYAHRLSRRQEDAVVEFVFATLMRQRKR